MINNFILGFLIVTGRRDEPGYLEQYEESNCLLFRRIQATEKNSGTYVNICCSTAPSLRQGLSGFSGRKSTCRNSEAIETSSRPTSRRKEWSDLPAAAAPATRAHAMGTQTPLVMSNDLDMDEEVYDADVEYRCGRRG